MDIDIDYFLNEQGEPWQDSQEFARAVRSVPVAFQTVAYSVMGGFTPNEQRRLAAPFVRGETGGYQASEVDRLAGLVRCHKYEEAIEGDWPADEGAEIEVGFLLGTSFQAKERYDEALDQWLRLLGNPNVGPGGRAYLHGLCAEIYNHQGKANQALEHSLKAQEIRARQPSTHLERGRGSRETRGFSGAPRKLSEKPSSSRSIFYSGCKLDTPCRECTRIRARTGWPTSNSKSSPNST